ncbi:MAG: hypothetical protein AB1593_07420 [Pseudomonadota bacterium]
MNTTELATPSECRAAFDVLLAGAHRQLRLYDHDLGLWALDEPARHAALRAFCVAGGGRRIECLLDEIDHVARAHPRLMQLVRDFGHVLEIRQAAPAVPRPDQAFVLADARGVLLRADKSAIHGTLHPDDPGQAAPLQQSFEGMWQRAQTHVSATTLGL